MISSSHENKLKKIVFVQRDRGMSVITFSGIEEERERKRDKTIVKYCGRIQLQKENKKNEH